MGDFSDRMAATALQLLTTYGQSISAVRNVTNGYSPITGIVTDIMDTTYTGVGYPSNYNAKQIDGMLIQQDDILLILRSTTEPLLNDIITISGKAYTALMIQKITAQGSNIIYKIQLRQ